MEGSRANVPRSSHGTLSDSPGSTTSGIGKKYGWEKNRTEIYEDDEIGDRGEDAAMH